MRTKFTLLVVLIAVFFSAQAQQQITNGNFENWTDNDPTGWSDIDQYLANLGLDGQTLVTKETTPANVANGTASVKMQTQYIAAASGNLTSLLSLGAFDINTTTGAVTFSGVAYPYRPDSVSFQYKYQVVQADTAQYGFFFTKWNTTNSSPDVIGGIPPGYVDFITDTTNSFHTLTLSPSFTSQEVPDTFGIYFISGGNNSSAGNTLWLDNIRMIFNGIGTDVADLNVNTTMSVFPVPTNVTLNISTSDAMLQNPYSIIDMTGRTIANGTIESNKSAIDVSAYPGGYYMLVVYDKNQKVVNQAKFAVAK